MKIAPIFFFAGISLATATTAFAAAGASGATITPPPMPPPFGPPPGGSATSSGASTGANGAAMTTGMAAGSARAATNPQPPPAAAQPAPASAAEPAPEMPVAVAPTGHIELFNGKDFSGWDFVMAGNTDPKATWSIADGVIKCTGRPNGYARTVQAYKDYMVTVEWRFLPGQTGNVNTGVLVHLTPPLAMNPSWPKCIECQGRHTNQGDFWFWGGASCQELSTLPADQIQGGARRNGIKRQAPDAEKPVGEWNTFTVICRGATVTILVNGKEVNKATGCNLTSGYLGLQSEGGPVEIRKVSLDPAPDETPKPPKELPPMATGK